MAVNKTGGEIPPVSFTPAEVEALREAGNYYAVRWPNEYLIRPLTSALTKLRVAERTRRFGKQGRMRRIQESD